MGESHDDQVTRYSAPTLTRRDAFRFGAAGILALPLVITQTGNPSAHGTPMASPEVNGDIAMWQDQMNAYSGSGEFAALQENAEDVTSSVFVAPPAIEFTGDGELATLPIGPAQFIYRFRNSRVIVPDPDHQPFSFSKSTGIRKVNHVGQTAHSFPRISISTSTRCQWRRWNATLPASPPTEKPATPC